MTRARSVAIALASMMFVAGCGGSHAASTGSPHTSTTASVTSTTTPTTTPAARANAAYGPTLSRAALIAKANAACRVISAQRSLIKVKTPADFSLALPRLVIFQQRLVSDFHQLGAPASLRGDWTTIVGDAEVLANSTLELAHTPQVTANGKRIRSLLAIFGQARLRMRATAKQAGFKDCAQY